MFSKFILPIPNVPHIYLYPKPINMRFGENKLMDICRKKMGLDPYKGFVFLFFNKAQNQMKLFYIDESGSNEMTKLLPQSAFLLPVPSRGQKYIKIEANKLQSLFRM